MPRKKSPGRLRRQLFGTKGQKASDPELGEERSWHNGSVVTFSALPCVHTSILSMFQCQADNNSRKRISSSLSCAASLDLTWYLLWLAQQLVGLPGTIIDILVKNDSTGALDLSRDSTLYRVFMTVNEYIRQNEHPSIDDIADYLVEKSILESTTEGSKDASAQRLLIFAVLGWQSMLYLPSFNNCSLDELAIHHDIEQPNSRLIFDTFKLSAGLADRPLSILMKGYGNLLPARPRELTKVASETSRVAATWSPVSPFETNAYFLHTLLGVQIRWVDTLALHLDFDKSSRTLSLFRYPSFCVAMLQSKGALYGFASSDIDSSDPRASEDDITDILHEALLSYRLLFGQSKRSRKLFRCLFGQNHASSHEADSFLVTLCTKELLYYPEVPQDRLTYYLHRDFPLLGHRLDLLVAELKGAKPKSWRDLVRDKRDTTQYWTFWLVAIIGGASIMLSFTQVLLQAVQIMRE